MLRNSSRIFQRKSNSSTGGDELINLAREKMLFSREL